MKKVMNNPEKVVDEMLEGIMLAYGHSYTKLDNVNGIIKKTLKIK